jgi:hypothetical protein
MDDYPLTVTALVERAERLYPARRLATALASLGAVVYTLNPRLHPEER